MIDWKFEDDRPIYTQLVEHIQLAIVTGVYPPGTKLPAVRELATEAGVNPNTMQRALAELEAGGLVFAQRTSGRFVTEDEALITALRKKLAEEVVAAFLTRMKGLGYTHSQIQQIVNETEEG